MLYELVMENTHKIVINNKNDKNKNKNKLFFCKSIEIVRNDSRLNTKESSCSKIVDETVELCEHDIIEDYVETGVESNMIKIRYCQICEVTFT